MIEHQLQGLPKPVYEDWSKATQAEMAHELANMRLYVGQLYMQFRDMLASQSSIAALYAAENKRIDALAKMCDLLDQRLAHFELLEDAQQEQKEQEQDARETYE